MIIVTQSIFEKLRFKNVFRPHENNEKPGVTLDRKSSSVVLTLPEIGILKADYKMLFPHETKLDWI